MQPRLRPVLIWAGLVAAIVVPIVVAATSPQLAWRSPVYIAAGFAGVMALALLLVQPLLASGFLPGLEGRRGRSVHRWVGIVLVVAVFAHVGGFWISNPQDLVDALLFRSPTAFSVWGVVAMGATFAAALLAALRLPLHLRSKLWRLGHKALATVIVVGSVIHALLIEGAMGPVSKAVLCMLAVTAMAKVLWDARVSGLWRVADQ